ncbi:GTPase-activating protein [Cladochytrium tenue]|nr:GTPase-activating protein [Cladochytrium tenue]
MPQDPTKQDDASPAPVRDAAAAGEGGDPVAGLFLTTRNVAESARSDHSSQVDIGDPVSVGGGPLTAAVSSAVKGGSNTGATDVVLEDAQGLGVRIPKEALRRVGYLELFRYASVTDWLQISIALVFAAAAGSANPFTSVLFGNLVNVFSYIPSPDSPNYGAWQENLTSEVSKNNTYMAIFVAVGERLTHNVREKYLLAVLRQNIGWHDHEGAGEVATRITTDMLLIQDAISEKVPIATSQAFTFIAGFCIAFYRSPKLAGVLLSAVPFLAGTVSVMNAITGRLQARILNRYSKAGNIAEEALSSVRTVTALNGQRKMSAYYASELKGARLAGVTKAAVTGAGFGCLFCFIFLSYALAFYYGSILLESNSVDAGTIVNVMFAVLMGANSLGQIAPELQAFAFGIGAGSKIFATLDRKPPIDSLDPTGDKIPDGEVRGHIELKDVEFTYPTRPDVKVLKKFSLVAHPGSTVALVGQSGSGKSTIIQLLERFYDPDAGEIFIDGHSIKELQISWLRRQIGYVAQEPTLFEGSVADNVALGLVGTPMEKTVGDERLRLVQDACRIANAHDFVSALPNGYDTQVGERGLLMSGGQKQRIAIARAVISNAKILLLDEATSALDTTSERVVQAALDNAAKGRTTIVIAHRLSTVRHADLIVCMFRGEVVEHGTHDELVARGGMYASLVEAQQLRQEEDAQKQSSSSSDEDDIKEDVVPVEDIPAAPSVHKSDRYSASLHTSDIETGGKRSMTVGHVISEIFKLNLPELTYTLCGLLASIVAEPTVQGVKDLRFWASMMVIIAFGAAVANLIQNWMFGLANEYLTERVRAKLFSAILQQEVAFFDDSLHSTGSLTSNLSTNAQKVQGAAGVTLGTVLQMVATLFGGQIVGFIYGWHLALLGMVLIPILIIAGFMRMRILRYFNEKAKSSYEKSAQVACESVAAIRTVQSLTTEGKVHEGYLKLLEGPLRDGYRNAYINTALYGFSQSANFLSNSLLFWFGGRLIAYNGYTIKDFFVVFMAVLFGATSAGRMFSFVPDVTKAKMAAEDILALLERKPLIDSNTETGAPVRHARVEGAVEFRDVHFVYPTRPKVKVLRGLNITANPGEFIALVGQSGCGKSTTVGLIERFYDVVSGTVTLDGRDIRSLNLEQYRNVIGLVSQEPNLYAMSIEDNVAFGCEPRPSRAEIEEACRDANIHDFIETLPDGYRTQVGSKGGQLSGGQKQRVAIARALVRRPKVLLLDEATSALDAESERVVQRALDGAAKGRTTIAIAHRLSTIQHADRIYVLKDGVVAECGTHQELYDKRGLYFELVVQQDLGGGSAN